MNTILVIGHGIPKPNATGAGVRMQQLLELLQEMGSVHFCSTESEEKAQILKQMQIGYSQIDLNSDTFNQFIAKLNPNLVVFDRFMTEEQYSWRVRQQCPDAIRILDTEDLHFLREQRDKTKSLTPSTHLSDLAKRELAAIFRSDFSLIISEVELDYLTELFCVPKTQLFYLPFLIKKPVNFTTLPDFNSRADFCFVGTGMHKPNVVAIQKLNQLWPELKKTNPKAKLHIYGAYLPAHIKHLDAPKNGFLVHGFVADIHQALKNHKVLIAPLAFGAGQKRKIFDAWLSGCPVVTTAVGAEGIASHSEFGGGIADSDSAIIAKSTLLNSDRVSWEQAQQKTQKILDKSFQWQAHATLFKAFINERLQKPELFNDLHTVSQMLWHHSLLSTKYLSKWIQEKNK